MLVILRTRVPVTLRQITRDDPSLRTACLNTLCSLKTVCRMVSYAVTSNDKPTQQTTDHADRTSSYQSAFGVFKESEGDDVDVLVNNFTSPALARALRERETTLHKAAHLAETHNYNELALLLKPFLKSSIDKRRNESFEWDISNGLTRRELILVQRQLHRMPREVFQATTRRASVVIPLCNVGGTCHGNFFHNYLCRTIAAQAVILTVVYLKVGEKCVSDSSHIVSYRFTVRSSALLVMSCTLECDYSTVRCWKKK